MNREIRILWFALALVSALSTVRCDCGSSGLHTCKVDTDCTKAGECCLNSKCTTEGCNTCPTQACTLAKDCNNSCMDCKSKCCVSLACATDSDCPADANGPRYCNPVPDPDKGCRLCDYVRCETDAQCADPTFPLYKPCSGDQFPKCVLGACQCAQPCGGACPDGTYCCKKTQTCDNPPPPCPGKTCPSCQQVNPTPGGTVNDQTCVVDGANCDCQHLPALPDAFAGQYSSIALGLDGIPVLSGYFGSPYGDLIYGVASAAQAGATVKWDFVDGVPANAPCTGDADGPRHGIAEPGDDVGWDTSIAVSAAGLARISYYDRTHGHLKYAAFDGAAWQNHTVDSAGDNGRFTSLALDSQGRPLIAYMTVKENLTAKLKLAWATVADPKSASDWTIAVADAAAVPCQTVDCPATQACLDSTHTCVDKDDPAHCSPACASGSVCVAAVCQKLAVDSSLVDIPPGVGVFASLALYPGDVPAIAYYDSQRGNLKFVWWNTANNAFDPSVILAGEDGSGNDLGNLGADSSLAITSDNVVHIAYQDAELGQLYYLSFPGTQTGSAAVELVDAGARDTNGNPTDVAHAVGGLHWVGNFTSVMVDPAGSVRLAYQDGTSLDLDYGMRNAAGVWTAEILAKKQTGTNFVGAYGFFCDQVMNSAGDKAIISNFKHDLRTTPYSSGIDLRVR